MKDIERMLGEILPEINFLKISSPKFKPGAILESSESDRWVDTIEAILESQFEKADFEKKTLPAALNLREAKGLFSGDAAVNILGILGLDLKRQSQVNLEIEISQVKVSEFKSERMGITRLEREFRRLRENDEATFRILRGRFFVFSSYYASQFKLRFNSTTEGEAGIDLETDLKKVDLGIDLSLENNIVLVSSNESIPFGVSGYKITKTGRILEV
ncbi:MAG: hypothetical protein WBA10_00960 [Elainellaceae cyanobacterium]